MPLTQEQFQKLRDNGFSTEKIVSFEKRREAESPQQNPNRLSLKSEQSKGGGDYNYGDAALDSAKTVVNSFANVGDAAMQPVLHPIKTATEAMTGIGNFIAHPINTIKDAGANLVSTNNPDNVPNWAYGISHDPASFVTGVVGAGAGVEGIGAIGASIGNKAVGAGRYFSRIKNTFNPQAIENLNVPSSARLSGLARDSQASAAKDIAPLQINIVNIKKTQDASNSAIQQSKIVLKDNLSKFKEDLQGVAEKKAVDFQNKLPELFEANGEAYGSARDAGIAKMQADGKGITFNEVSNAIAEAKKEIQAALVPSDAPAMKVIGQLEEKYSPKMVGSQSGILDANGKPIIKELPNTGNDFVDAAELIQDLRNVKSTLSSGAKAGRTGFNQEDLAVGFLNHSLGDIIKTRVPGFAKLQSDYTPVIRAMKEAHKIFKPNQGEFNTSTATNFLKKAGTGKLEAGQERMLNALEQGSGFAPGVGPLSQEVKIIGARIKQAQDGMAALEKQKLNIKGLTESQILKNTAAIEARKSLLQKRLDSLQSRSQNITRLEANKNVADKIKKALFGKAIDSIPGGKIISKF